jgi:hypothetical protein
MTQIWRLPVAVVVPQHLLLLISPTGRSDDILAFVEARFLQALAGDETEPGSC